MSEIKYRKEIYTQAFLLEKKKCTAFQKLRKYNFISIFYIEIGFKRLMDSLMELGCQKKYNIKNKFKVLFLTLK